jgi:predicted porin
MKKILALAIASAFAAPAFAATSNVDIYGKLSYSVNFVDDQNVSNSDLQFTNNSSRIGFKGAEDLGGGLSAIWQVESSVNMDEGGGFGGGRNTFIGLKGGWGTVLGGKHDTPLKSVGRAVDMFGDGFADSRNVLGGGSDTRADNVVAYLSPNFSGFAFAAAYSTDLSNTSSLPVLVPAATADADNRDLYNLSATYTNGPLYVGLAYGDGDGHEALGVGSQWRIAGGFNFGDFRIVGQYDSLEDDDTVNAAAQNGDFDAWMVGASYTMGAMVFKGNYMSGEFDGIGGAEPEQWTIGMDYNLSKRTAIYGLYVSGDQVTLGAGAGLGDKNASCATCGGDISGFSVGMSHSF